MLGRKPFPMAFGDHFNGSVDHFDGGLVVNRIRRTLELGRPSLSVGHRVFRQHFVIQVREDREVNEPQRFVPTAGRLPANEVLADARGHHHASGAQPHPDGLERRQQVRQPGLPHPMAQVQGVTAVDQQHVGLSDPAQPAFRLEAGKRGQFQHAQGLPTQFGHGASGFSSTDETPCSTRTALGMAVPRSGNAEGVGFGNRFAQEIDQRIVDARVFDASGGEQKFHDSLGIIGQQIIDNPG
jgi:hypothetical protein